MEGADLQVELVEDLMHRSATHHLNAEKIADLAGSDEQGRPGGEADHHAMGDEIDQGAHAGEAKR